jgi:tRNA nucleotidyltransferase (CCA-adding enzyme)
VSAEERSAEAGHELLEHTADVGIRTWGPTREVAFAEAALGLVELLDVRGSGKGRVREIHLTGPDPGSLLVDFLNELIVILETEDVAVTGARVRRAADDELEADVLLAAPDHPPEGVVVKAATYHGLAVETRPDGTVEARVFLDV